MAKKLDEVVSAISNNPVALKSNDGDYKQGKEIVSHYENKRRNPQMDVLFAYAQIFDVSIDYLVGFSDDMKPEYKSAKKELHLDDEAIRNLKSMYSHIDEEGDAKCNLKQSVNKTGLENTIIDFSSCMIKPKNISCASKMTAALNSAEQVKNNSESTQEEVNKAIIELENTMYSLPFYPQPLVSNIVSAILKNENFVQLVNALVMAVPTPEEERLYLDIPENDKEALSGNISLVSTTVLSEEKKDNDVLKQSVPMRDIHEYRISKYSGILFHDVVDKLRRGLVYPDKASNMIKQAFIQAGLRGVYNFIEYSKSQTSNTEPKGR